MPALLDASRFVAAKALHRILGAPLRRARFRSRKDSFVFRSPLGPVFKLDPSEFIDQEIACEGLYERRFLEYIRAILPRDALIVDVGANIGNHAIYLAAGAKEVHCFEPNPRAIERLELNIRLSNASNVVVHRFGLSDADGIGQFYDNSSGNLGRSGFNRTFAERYTITHLPVFSGDEAISRVGMHHIDYIKIDVEGDELKVLRGLGKTIRTHQPLISFEYVPYFVGSDYLQEIAACLPDYIIVEPRFSAPRGSPWSILRWHLRRRGTPELRLMREAEDRCYENLLALPKESPLVREVVKKAAPTDRHRSRVTSEQ